MRTLALACVLLLAACTPSTIPGTRIRDTPDMRAVLDVLSRYKSASESLDADGVIALAAPDYFDKGQPGKGGQRNLATLTAELPQQFKKLKALKMDLTVKDARILDDGKKAEIDYFVVLHYSIALPQGGERWTSESDDARLSLARVDGQWKATAGL